MEQFEKQETKPLVSVVCITYNHEKYIQQCLDGFLMQKTKFPFEIIIHDDASTDKTAAVIRSYQQKYPKIIHCICQKENQFQKRVNITGQFIIPLIRGKYVAFCEGDDYWCDEEKLQRQVDALENHPQAHMCLHRVLQIEESGKTTKKTMPWFRLDDEIMSSERFLMIDEGHNFQASSYFFRSSDFLEYHSHLPSFRQAVSVGDSPYMLFFASLGDTVYLDRIMSCHRQCSLGSWSQTQYSASMDEKDKHFRSVIRMFELYDEYTNHKFHDIIIHRIRKTQFDSLFAHRDYKELWKRENREFILRLPPRARASVLIGTYLPHFMQFYHFLMRNNKRRDER